MTLQALLRLTLGRQTHDTEPPESDPTDRFERTLISPRSDRSPIPGGEYAWIDAERMSIRRVG